MKKLSYISFGIKKREFNKIELLSKKQGREKMS